MIKMACEGRGEKMIKINNLYKAYDNDPVLNGLNLHMTPGEFIFLQGESGSGKSTLLKILYRDIKTFEGEVQIKGKSIQTMPNYVTRRLVGTIFQSFELLERKTALENVALAGEVLGGNEADIQAKARNLLDQVGLKGKEDRFPHQLSGGEQQRVAIARALVNRPVVLLADEPTGNLDPKTALRIMELLQRINEEEKITMLIVTHSHQLAQSFATRTLTMVEGRVRESEYA
jgi:cell division transport system ATP-binding protein